MRIAGMHPTGNANSREAMSAYAEAGWLECFFTTIAVFKGNLWHRLSDLSGLSEFTKRQFPESLRAVTHSRPSRELMRLAAQRLGWQAPQRHETGWASVDAVYRGIDQSLAIWIESHRPDVVHAYEDGALQSFQAAGRVGTRCVLDHPVAHWRRVRSILEEERDAAPEWASTLVGLRDSDEKRDRKDQELQLADLILVPSRFSLESLDSCPFAVGKRVVLPLGGPVQASFETLHHNTGQTLRVLFVGSLSQLKGLSYLFEAVETLGSRIELTLIGRPPLESCRILQDHLARHRWIPALSHAGVLDEMTRHDVLVFPSLCDGFGMVVTEALSRGLPVITTPRTCGPDIIEEGVSGYVIPARDAMSISEKLDMLDRDRDRLAFMRRSALQSMRHRTWSSYRAGLLELVGRLAPVCPGIRGV